MKILALDQASQTSGFAIIEDEHLLENYGNKDNILGQAKRGNNQLKIILSIY